MHLSIQVSKGKPGELEIAFSYNEEYIAKVKSIRGRKWDMQNKKWLVPDSKESMEQLLKLFTRAEISFDNSIIGVDKIIKADKYSEIEQYFPLLIVDFSRFLGSGNVRKLSP